MSEPTDYNSEPETVSYFSRSASPSILSVPGSPIFLSEPENLDPESSTESPELNPDPPPSPILQNSNQLTQNQPPVSDHSQTYTEPSIPLNNSRATTAAPWQPSTSEDSNSIPEPNNCEEPPAKMRKIASPNEDIDGETCPICLDSWGNSGEHRLVALKCGHLFGSQCIRRWLKTMSARDQACPTCKSKANVKDIRHIYARRLVATDTSQITTLQKQIDTLTSEKSRTELELQKSKIAYKACTMQLEVLRGLMKSQVKEQPARKTWRFSLEKNLEICKDGGCRVLTYNCRTYELYVTQKSVNYLFPGYGIRKINCVDFSLGAFAHLHPKPIRDITYSQPRDLLLSVALDSTARIVERGFSSVVVNAGMPLWSCSWDYLRSNEFYVGGVGGVIRQYDVRNPSTYLNQLSAPGDISPVVSLCSTEFGLLSCQLNSCWLWSGNNRVWEPRAMPVEGSFMSMCYDNESHRAVISSRPTDHEKAKLTVCKLRASVPNGEVIADVEETFTGSARASLMSRVNIVKIPGASWVAAHSESDSSTILHGLDGTRTMSLPSTLPSLDIGCVELNGTNIIAALSETRLRLYKAVIT